MKIKWCDLCQSWYIKCPTCGNNSCNGGHGEINGKACKTCKTVYELQDEFNKNRKLNKLLDALSKIKEKMI